MRILRLRQAQTDHKVSSAEMHVKRFKRAPEVSFALSSSSFPSYPHDDPVSIAPFVPALESILLTNATGSSHELPSLDAFALWNEPRTGLFIVCLPSSKRVLLLSALKRALSSVLLLPFAVLLTDADDDDAPLPLSLKQARRETAEKSHAAANTRCLKIWKILFTIE